MKNPVKIFVLLLTATAVLSACGEEKNARVGNGNNNASGNPGGETTPKPIAAQNQVSIEYTNDNGNGKIVKRNFVGDKHPGFNCIIEKQKTSGQTVSAEGAFRVRLRKGDFFFESSFSTGTTAVDANFNNFYSYIFKAQSKESISGITVTAIDKMEAEIKADKANSFWADKCTLTLVGTGLLSASPAAVVGLSFRADCAEMKGVTSLAAKAKDVKVRFYCAVGEPQS